LKFNGFNGIGFIENLKNDYFKEISQMDKSQQNFSEDFPLPKLLPREKQ
jgi:hypothetical protein